MQEELKHLDTFIRELEDIGGMEIRTLEYGPGFFVPYFVKDKSDTDRRTCWGNLGEILDGIAVSWQNCT